MLTNTHVIKIKNTITVSESSISSMFVEHHGNYVSLQILKTVAKAEVNFNSP